VRLLRGSAPVSSVSGAGSTHELTVAGEAADVAADAYANSSRAACDRSLFRRRGRFAARICGHFRNVRTHGIRYALGHFGMRSGRANVPDWAEQTKHFAHAGERS
jgi:hypothetical protein